MAIARAIAKRPELLLCDEPTGALDYATGKLVLEVIARINAELGTTAIVITHNAAIAGMADRVRLPRRRPHRRHRATPRASSRRRSCPGEAALDRKLLRDLRRLWSQALTIALVVGERHRRLHRPAFGGRLAGVARDRFYADGRFADVFASAKRAPHALAEALRARAGRGRRRDPRGGRRAAVQSPGVAPPMIARLIGFDFEHPPG